MKERVSTIRIQYQIFSVLLITVVFTTWLLSYTNSLLFQRFLGELNPVFTIFIISILGFLALFLLLSKAWFSIYKKDNLTKFLHISWLSIVFASIAILIDLKIVFPAEMNISFPTSLLFYPVIGFFAEILFHVLPMTMLLLSFASVFKNTSHEKLIWICIIIVATLEPVYQAFYMGSYSGWAIVAVWLNLFIFNLTQLLIFKRYDFISMYLFRLIYYAIWHVIWGHARLTVLF